MRARANRGVSEPSARRWRRHAVALVGALVLNGMLVALLVTWMGRSRHEPPVTLWAVPIEVMRQAPEETEISDRAPDNVAVIPPAPPEALLPEPPVPVVSAPTLSVAAPLPPALQTARTPSLDVPLYAAAASDVAPEIDSPGATAPAAAPAAAPGPTAPAPGPAAAAEAALSRGPVLIEPPDLAAYYPRRARMQGVAGTTRIRLTLAADGRVTEVEVLDSTPPGVFEMAARRVGEALQFRPAVRDGRPVAARVSLNLVWRLE